ncbi:MAG: proton-conducting transporter membrane subunit [Mycobacterium sp.]|nr:proton-conducting transporter membrane subunit [Mycobacterium sp.]
MWITGSGTLAAMLTTPAIAAALSFVFGQRAPRRFVQVGALTAGLGFLGAVALAVGSARGVSPSAHILGGEFNVDRLAAVLLLLVFGVSAIVQTYAVRYLTGDPRAAWFAGGAGLLTAASAGLTAAASLVTLAACWTLAGVALCLLLATYWQLPAARDGWRRTVMAFLIGDLALWVAVVAATATWGRIDLRAEGPAPVGGTPAILGVLVVLAALSRSAQIPFHRWLPATLAAPTPVSALLHAGVVNAGAILLIRTAPLAADDLARTLTVIAGAATMAYGAAVMLVKPDVKGALAHSTTAQMGFMILTCGLGLWAAAVIHLVAHGFYKATLFLSSGSAIAGHRRHRSLPPARRLTGRQTATNAVACVALPAAALAAALAVVPLAPGEHAAEQALLIFAWVTGAAVTWGWLRRRPGLSGTLVGAAVLLPVAIGYVAIINALSGFLAPALPASGLAGPAVWAVTIGAALLLGALALARRAPGAERIRRALYTSALTAGHIPSRNTYLTGARS